MRVLHWAFNRVTWAYFRSLRRRQPKEWPALDRRKVRDVVMQQIGIQFDKAWPGD